MIKIQFNDDNISCEAINLNYNYIETDPKKLYRVLQLLIDHENEVEFELNSDKIIAKKFYDILDKEFNQELF